MIARWSINTTRLSLENSSCHWLIRKLVIFNLTIFKSNCDLQGIILLQKLDTNVHMHWAIALNWLFNSIDICVLFTSVYARGNLANYTHSFQFKCFFEEHFFIATKCNCSPIINMSHKLTHFRTFARQVLLVYVITCVFDCR
jgi:hypothetical protein